MATLTERLDIFEKHGFEEMQFSFADALRDGDEEEIGRLLEISANPDAVWSNRRKMGDYGIDLRSALHFAVETNQQGILAKLLEALANTNHQDEYGMTALMMAAEKGDECVASMLLDARADAEVADALGQTALHYAAHKGHAEIASELLKAGADLEHPSLLAKHTALQVCEKHSHQEDGHVEVAQLLREWSARVIIVLQVEVLETAITTVICRNLAGEEVATLSFEKPGMATVAAIRHQTSQCVGHTVVLTLADGTLLTARDHATVVTSVGNLCQDT